MLVLLVVTALVTTAGLLAAARLAGGSMTSWLVGTYVLSFAGIVVLSLALSVANAFTRWGALASTLAAAAVAVLFVRPGRFPSTRTAALAARDAFRDPVLAVVGVVSAGVLVYSTALALIPPPNDEDALSYHLARAAFWAQQQAIGYIPGAADSRLDEFAPTSEIAAAFTMVASDSGRYAPLVQLGAAVAAAGAICGVARRIGLPMRASLLGALLFFTAPVVALQASTGLNDVVVASFAACSAYFLLGTTRADLVLAGVSVALLVGTKLTGILSLPGLALLVVVARRQRPLAVLAVLGGSAVAGCYWYAFNVTQGREAFGGIGGERVAFDPVAAAARVVRLALAAFELPGAAGRDRLLYVAAAAALASVALITAGSRVERVRRATIAAAATLLPLLVVWIDDLLVRGSQKVFHELGREDVGYLDPGRSFTKASPIFSWYGSAGALLTALSIVLVVREVRRGRLPLAALVLASAPVLWIVLLGIGVPYWEWNGRYAIGGFALGAAMWGLVLRLQSVAWATAAVVTITSFLSFVHLHERASGLRALEPTSEPSVWTEPDWSIQAADNPHLRALYRFFEEHVPGDARVAVEPEVWPDGSAEGGNLPMFPFLGRDLSRTVHFATSPSTARAVGADWALLRGGAERCAAGWRIAFRYGRWVVLRRSSGATCR